MRMKYFLKYNYNLKDPTIYKVKNSIRIKDGEKRYILCETDKLDELENINQIIEQEHLRERFYYIQKSKDNQLYSILNGHNYVLLETHKIKENLSSPIKLTTKINGEIVKTDWKKLWIKKKDYYSKIINKNSKEEYDITIYNYYDSMAETAIAYVNGLNPENKTQILTYRVLEEGELYNPLNLIVDIEERELSEKIRKIIRKQDITTTKLNQLLSNYENINLELVYARLIFPNYYYDGLLVSAINNMQFKMLISEITNYENRLKEIYKEFTKKQDIKKIDWL